MNIHPSLHATRRRSELLAIFLCLAFMAASSLPALKQVEWLFTYMAGISIGYVLWR